MSTPQSPISVQITSPNDPGKWKEARDWTTTIVAVAALLLGLLNLVRSSGEQERVDAIEVTKLLDKAWDVLGGKPYTTVIPLDGLDRSDADVEKARRLINEAFMIDDENARAFCIKGVFHSARGEMEEAIEAFSTAVDLDPESSMFRADLGSALEQEGRLAEALDAFSAASRLQPKSGAFHSRRAYLLLDLGRSADADEAANLARQHLKDSTRFDAMFEARKAST